MSLTTLLDNVIEITRRPDTRSRALLSLNSLILEISTNDDYGQDLIEATVLNPDTEGSNVAQLSLTLVGYPAVRKIAYVQANQVPMQSVSPDNILRQGGGCSLTNIYYRSGNTIVVNSRLAFTELRMGYYQAVPSLAEAPGLDQHWLIDEYEAMLTNGTIGRIFMATGDDESAAYYEGLYRTQRLNIRAGLAEGQ